MALSNYDHYGMLVSGHQRYGIEAASGVSCMLYKNWVYIQDPKIWQPRFQFAFPTVAKLEEGKHSSRRGLNVIAERGPQNGVLVWAWVEGGQKPDHCFVGIGVYGFGYPLGVDYPEPPEVPPADADEEAFLAWFKEYEQWEENEPDQVFHGVLPSSVETLIRRTESLVAAGSIPPLFAETPWEKGQRVNHGDRFIADACGIETPSTPPGSPENPLLLSILQSN